MLFVITIDNMVISEPMTLKDIEERFGSVAKLEQSGVVVKQWGKSA